MTSRPTSGAEDVVVTQPEPNSPWEWEIYRNGEPLPARLREGGFTFEGAARSAGKFALLEFLAALAGEENQS